MMNKKEAWEYLNSIGIYTQAQLREAIKKIEIDIGMFTYKEEK